MQLTKRMPAALLAFVAVCPSPAPIEEERTTDVAPASIVYDGGKALRPRTAGGLATRYVITPALPAGLTFDESLPDF